MKSNLQPTSIVDKNGKHTTVHKKVAVVPDRASDIAVTSLATASQDDFENTQSHRVGKWLVAPEGMAGAICQYCGEFATRSFVKTVTFKARRCENCDEYCDLFSLEPAIRAEDAELADTQKVYERDWYHYTTSKNWYEDVTRVNEEKGAGGILVHLGSVDAALERSEAFTQTKKPPVIYGYKIRVKAGAPISDTINDDHNDNAPISPRECKDDFWNSIGYDDNDEEIMAAPEDTQRYEPYGATRYVNNFEAIGSVSLLANPLALELVDTFVVR